MISTKELEGKIYEDDLTHIKYVRAVCKCGHTTYFLKNTPTMCSHCNRTIYPTQRTKFKDKINKLMKRR